MDAGPFPMSKWRFVALVAVLSFGFAALFGALGIEALAGPLFVVGFFLVVPLAILLGDDFPGIGSESDEDEQESDRVVSSDPDDQIERLRERYARGEIDEAEFERRVERLLETKDLEEEVAAAERGRELDLE